MKVILISEIFRVCYCWFIGIFTRASFIRGDYCLHKFQRVQISFLHQPFLIFSILIEVSCVCITVTDSILYKYVVEYGNRIIITALEITVYTFLSESRNFTKRVRIKFQYKHSYLPCSRAFRGSDFPWTPNGQRTFDPTFKIIKIQIRAV